jgi:hypothetical protein
MHFSKQRSIHNSSVGWGADARRETLSARDVIAPFNIYIYIYIYIYGLIALLVKCCPLIQILLNYDGVSSGKDIVNALRIRKY